MPFGVTENITVTVYLLVFKMGTCIGKRIEMVFLSQNHSYNIIASRIQFKLALPK
jgi:hypothetical protein